jgi:hypothetical protein
MHSVGPFDPVANADYIAVHFEFHAKLVETLVPVEKAVETEWMKIGALDKAIMQEVHRANQ